MIAPKYNASEVIMNGKGKIYMNWPQASRDTSYGAKFIPFKNSDVRSFILL